jgi:uncharacterized protein YxeA
MKKRIVITIIMVAVFVAAFIAVVVIKNNTPATGKTQSYSSMEEAEKAAPFNMDYSDRLCGYPATDFEANSSTIEVHYADAGFIRKTLGVIDNSGNNTEYSESSEQSINGLSVTLKGNDGLVYLAVWNDNNFAYTISVNEGISIDEMTEYIEATQ